MALVSSPSMSTADAFVSRHNSAVSSRAFQKPNSSKVARLSSTATAVEIPTKAIEGMKPGTSGLRKKVEVWQAVDEANKNYVENFIQSLIDTATEKNGDKVPDT